MLVAKQERDTPSLSLFGVKDRWAFCLSPWAALTGRLGCSWLPRFWKVDVSDQGVSLVQSAAVIKNLGPQSPGIFSHNRACMHR